MKRTKSHLDRQVLSVCKQLLDGVNFLHSQLEVAHMDIKPDNLVLDVSDNDSPMFILKIIDFDISVLHANRMVGGVRGTEGYMAPEVKECNQYWPMLADRYSCGTCLEVFLEQGQNVVNCYPCYRAVAAFAAKLRNRSPSQRPALLDCPQLHLFHHSSNFKC